MRRIIAIYCDQLLGISETFIRSQVEGIKKFLPVYVGTRRISGIVTPDERTIVLNNGGILGRAGEIAFKLWGVSPYLKKALRRVNPVLVHAHYGPNGLRALPLARSIRQPLVVTFHGSDANVNDAAAEKAYYAHRVYVRRKHILQREAKLFIAVSEFIRNQLLKQGFAPDRVRTHYIGVDTELFLPDPLVLRLPIVLSVGNLIENKGTAQLIRAMALLQGDMPEAELVIIGDGPLRADLELQAKRTLRRYRFLGHQPHSAVRQWMNLATVLAQPSITLASGAAEGLPTVIAEAQAMGTPVVASRMAGIPEIIADGENGFLVCERDEQTLAARIALLLRDKAAWHSFSRTGQELIRSKFNLREQCHKLEEIYEETASASLLAHRS